MRAALPPEHERLSRRELRVFLTIARWARATDGTAHRGCLKPRERKAVPSLWRRGLVEVWYQQSAFIEPSLIGPFYCLSRRGVRLADILFSKQRPAKERPMLKRAYDPAEGQAFQGDVAIVPVPAGIEIARREEIVPVKGRLILQEGEVTGHHHAIELGRERRKHFKPAAPLADPVLTTRSTRLKKAFGGMPRRMKAADLAVAVERSATAKLFRDAASADLLTRQTVKAANGKSAPLLTRSDLCVGFLVVEGGPLEVSHEEHDSIVIPEGVFYVGRQVESAGAEERAVQD